MRYNILTTLILAALLAGPSEASRRQCDQAMIDAGGCRAGSSQALAYDAPAADWQDLVDAYAQQHNYQATVPCTSNRQYSSLQNQKPNRIVVTAGINQGDCSVQGAEVANPQSKDDFLDAVIDAQLKDAVISWKLAVAQQQAADPSTIPTPDVGGQ